MIRLLADQRRSAAARRLIRATVCARHDLRRWPGRDDEAIHGRGEVGTDWCIQLLPELVHQRRVARRDEAAGSALLRALGVVNLDVGQIRGRLVGLGREQLQLSEDQLRAGRRVRIGGGRLAVQELDQGGVGLLRQLPVERHRDLLALGRLLVGCQARLRIGDLAGGGLLGADRDLVVGDLAVGRGQGGGAVLRPEDPRDRVGGDLGVNARGGGELVS